MCKILFCCEIYFRENSTSNLENPINLLLKDKIDISDWKSEVVKNDNFISFITYTNEISNSDLQILKRYLKKHPKYDPISSDNLLNSIETDDSEVDRYDYLSFHDFFDDENIDVEVSYFKIKTTKSQRDKTQQDKDILLADFVDDLCNMHIQSSCYKFIIEPIVDTHFFERTVQYLKSVTENFEELCHSHPLLKLYLYRNANQRVKNRIVQECKTQYDLED